MENVSITKLSVDNFRCLLCGLCSGACPNNAILILNSGISFDGNKCKLCGICEKICPIGALSIIKQEKDTT